MKSNRAIRTRYPRHLKSFKYDKPRLTQLGPVFDPGPPLSNEQLLRAFAKYKCALPREYSRFLRTCNGGWPERSWFVIHVGTRCVPTQIACFYGVREDDPFTSIAAWMRTMEKRIPSKLVPIAAALGDDQILLSLRLKDNGHIYLWHRRWRKSNKYARIEPLAQSFSTFANQLLGRTEKDLDELAIRLAAGQSGRKGIKVERTFCFRQNLGS